MPCEGRVTKGGVVAEREAGRAGEREREGEESGCDPHPEMLCWLREDEMSVQELLQRVQCVITHVGESPHLSPFFPSSSSSYVKSLNWFKKNVKRSGGR